MDQEEGNKDLKISKRKLQQNFIKTQKDNNVRVFTPQELLTIDKLYPGGVKLTVSETIIQKQQIKLVDLKNAGHNFIEDEFFAHQPNLLHNIRRGITVITEGVKQPQILRRGLKKFFDIDLSILNQEKQQIGRVDRVLYNYTMKEVLECLDVKKHPISIYVLEKANGENAQISYYQPLNRWVICSKNVAFLYSEDDNLDLIQEQRYKFVKLISQIWKQYLQTLDQNFIKQTLQDHTLIGEYCGDQSFQHIVNYQEIQLRFYALVNHHSMDTCIDPIKTQEFLNKSKLQSVKITYQTQVNNVENLKNSINLIYQQISVAKLEDQGEGAVIYMVDDTERRCISLGKIKTLRYRLLRKIREKTKNYVSQFDLTKPQKSQEEVIDLMCIKYNNEIESLCKGIQVNFDLQEYINLLKTSLTCVYQFLAKSNKQNLEQNQKHCLVILASRYVDYYDQVSKGNMNVFFELKQI